MSKFCAICELKVDLLGEVPWIVYLEVSDPKGTDKLAHQLCFDSRNWNRK